MFEFAGLWVYAVLLVILLPMAFVGRRKQKGLKSPKKELTALRYSLFLFGIMAIFSYWNFPSFFHFSYIPTEINDFNEVRTAVRIQAEDFNRMNDGLKASRRDLDLLLIIFGVAVLPAAYSFAKALVPKDPDDPDDLDKLSIFREGNEN